MTLYYQFNKNNLNLYPNQHKNNTRKRKNLTRICSALEVTQTQSDKGGVPQNGVQNGRSLKFRVKEQEEVVLDKELAEHELEQLYREHSFSEPWKLLKDGPPRFCTPLVPWMSHKNSQQLPLMIYLPGIDGTGFAAYRQFAKLKKYYDLTQLTIPSTDRTSFVDLIAIAKEYLVLEAEQNPVDRPIYLVGDSFGGLLAMAVAVECRDIVDRLILVNPASSFRRTQWSALAPFLSLLPDDVYNFVPYAAIPFFGNPLGLVSHRVNPSCTPIQQALQLYQGMLEQLPEIETLGTLLPADCLMWKATLVEQGCQYMEKQGYHNIQQRTLILSAEQDLVIPSKDEGQRLQKILPRAKNVAFPSRAHAILLESGMNLPEIIKENGFYTEKRNMTSVNGNGRKGNGFISAGPIELPTEREKEIDIKGDGDLASHQNQVRLVSPVYFSTDQNGRVIQGLDHLPMGKQLLLVGNHQFMGLDMPFVVLKLLEERGILVRGMAHPIIFVPSEDVNDGGVPAGLFTSYGAVPNTPINMHKLLQMGESLMLFPGGAVEALKKQKYKYQIMWPKKAEFVRMASKFETTIVPFSSVGVEDSFIEILAAEDVLKTPILGDYFKTQLEKTAEKHNIDPRAWQGKEKELQADLAFPLALPSVPSRYYIKFGKPVHTKLSWVKDKEKCTEVYHQVKASVSEGLTYLQEKRKCDPYKDLVPRLVYESTWGFGTQAPTFVP